VTPGAQRAALAADPFLDAARSVIWLDLMMWNAAVGPHLPWPTKYIAPNIDLSVVFHRPGAPSEWLLADAEAPHASGGLLGCNGRVWSEQGELVASAVSNLFCQPNPNIE
jgi:acyl-CoA thioesterase-2